MHDDHCIGGTDDTGPHNAIMVVQVIFAAMDHLRISREATAMYLEARGTGDNRR
jgi:hypothetical protein